MKAARDEQGCERSRAVCRRAPAPSATFCHSVAANCAIAPTRHASAQETARKRTADPTDKTDAPTAASPAGSARLPATTEPGAPAKPERRPATRPTEDTRRTEQATANLEPTVLAPSATLTRRTLALPPSRRPPAQPRRGKTASLRPSASTQASAAFCRAPALAPPTLCGRCTAELTPTERRKTRARHSTATTRISPRADFRPKRR